MSATAVSASKSFGTCGTQIEVKPAASAASRVGDEPRAPSRGTGPSRGRSSGRSAPVPLPRRRPTLTTPAGVAMAFSFCESVLAHRFGAGQYSRRTVRGGAHEPGRRRDRRRIRHGPRRSAGASPAPGTASRCSTSTATPPRPRPTTCGPTGATALGLRGRRDRPRRRSTPRSTRCAASSGPSRSWSPAPASTSSRPSPTSRSTAWERMLAVNLTGTFHCLQAAIPDMLAAGWGRIVTISSSSAQSGAAAHGALRRVEGRRHRAHEGAGGRATRRTASP